MKRTVSENDDIEQSQDEEVETKKVKKNEMTDLEKKLVEMIRRKKKLSMVRKLVHLDPNIHSTSFLINLFWFEEKGKRYFVGEWGNERNKWGRDNTIFRSGFTASCVVLPYRKPVSILPEVNFFFLFKHFLYN